MKKDKKQENSLFWILAALFLIAAVIAVPMLLFVHFSQDAVQEHVLSESKQPVRTETEVPARPDRRYFYAGHPVPQPEYPYQITVLTNIGYVVGYVDDKKAPVWVGYRIFQAANIKAPERPGRFSVDDRTVSRLRHDDYTHSGYDRGHMAPNYAIAVCYGREAQLETFLMSNIIPQKPSLNRRVWNNLEQAAIRDWAQRFEEIWVITGGLFDGMSFLDSGVAVPKACYKIFLDEKNGNPRVKAFIIGQDVEGNECFTEFKVSVRDIEGKTGLDFFAGLPGDLQDRIELSVGDMW